MDREQERRERFAALAREHGRAMFRAARAVLDSDADAQDAVGEALLRAWQSFDRLRDPAAAKPWLLKIAVNCARTQLRRARAVLPLEEAAGAAAPAEEPLGLWELVQALPEDQRLAVTLYYYDGLSVGEIARVLGVPQGTVKSRLARGRDRLRERCMEEGIYEL